MVIAALFLVWWQAASLVSVCRDADHAAVRDAEQAVARGDAAAASAMVRAQPQTCPRLRLVVLALYAWDEARHLASLGGPLEEQRRAREALTEIESLGVHPDLALDAEYAATAVRAALAAAQDERPEMELLLTHARDLAERLARRESRPLWPRSFNLLAGELWFEVDRYAEARAAFERAVVNGPSPLAQVGLARALAREGQPKDACTIYRQVTSAAPALVAAAAGDLGHCR